jgi:hypothetical protein
MRTDGRRERNARFGCRKKSGATETLISKKVVLRQQDHIRPLVLLFSSPNYTTKIGICQTDLRGF